MKLDAAPCGWSRPPSPTAAPRSARQAGRGKAAGSRRRAGGGKRRPRRRRREEAPPAKAPRQRRARRCRGQGAGARRPAPQDHAAQGPAPSAAGAKRAGGRARRRPRVAAKRGAARRPRRARARRAPRRMKLLLVAVGQRQPAWADAAYDDFAKRFPPELRLELKAREGRAARLAARRSSDGRRGRAHRGRAAQGRAPRGARRARHAPDHRAAGRSACRPGSATAATWRC